MESRSFWRSSWGIALCGLLVIAALGLLLDHRDHALQYLPYLLILACPLMHFFMPGHGHGGSHQSREGESGGVDRAAKK